MTVLPFSILLIYLLFFPKDQCEIRGNVSGFPDSTLIYLVNISTDETIDSAIIWKNTFQFSAHLSDPPEQLSINTIIGQKYIYAPLLIGNEKISVRGDISDFPWNVEIKGSESQDDVNELNVHTRKYNILRDSLVKAYFDLSLEMKEGNHKRIWGEIGKVDSILVSVKLNFIESHPNSYASIIQLGYMKSKLSKDSLRNIVENFSTEIKESKYGKMLEFYIQSDILSIGDDFHDFEGINAKGESVKFSALRKNYSLLDFTMANCMPCRKAADELRELSENYADSLCIVSFSIDPKKATWLHSLERDRINWTSLWDGKGMYGKTSLIYGVNAFPTFVLIDQNGKIIDKWNGYKENSIKEHLEKNHFSF